MTNKVLALLVLVPLGLAFSAGFWAGFFDVDVDMSGFESFMGLLILFFATWASVRLYKTPEAN